MRLIDADALIAEGYVLEKFGESNTFISRKSIADVPTAYDVEKVVEQISENGKKMSETKSNMPYGKSISGCHNYYKAISVKKAIDIVRGRRE